MKRLFIYLVLACTALTAWGQTINELLPKANAGDAQAQFKMGEIYYLGLKVNEDYGKAYRWFIMTTWPYIGSENPQTRTLVKLKTNWAVATC